MQPDELIKLVRDPSALRESHLPALKEVVKEFPYFQSAQVLLCLASRRWDANSYQEQLKKAAILSSSRSRLYELVALAESQMAGIPEPLNEARPQPAKRILDPAVEEELKILDAAATLPGNPHAGHPELLPDAEQEKEASERMELEILKEAVVAVVDKEIIRPDKRTKDSPAEEKKTKTPSKSPETFNDWLQQLKSPDGSLPVESQTSAPTKEQKPEKAGTATGSGDIASADEAAERKRKQQAIIDRIIEKSPGAIRPREDQKFFTPERKAKESLLENEHLVTETLARIYAMQGNVAKAIRSYEILSLKYPQKSVYFASLIQKLKQNQ